jgi:hypothetical protein
VSLVGTFLFFPLFGFTINTLSLFGLVLAIADIHLGKAEIERQDYRG